MINVQGLPVRLQLRPGEAFDKTAAPELLDGLRLACNAISDPGDTSQVTR